MPHRTHLTTPPGGTPVTEDDAREGRELYTPGLALPVEPGVPSRFRGLLVTFGVLVGLLLVGWIAFQLVTAGQDFDPSLDVDPQEEFDPTFELPGEDVGG